MRVLLCVPAISAGMLVAALALEANTAVAAIECITEPNREPPEGGHWNYRVDRATNRRCWFLAKLTTAPAAAQTRRTSARLTVAREPSTSGQTGQRSMRKLSEFEQEALFLEFLRWKEQHSAMNSNAVESLRGAISP
jgi:hypothetical protein